MPNRALDVNSGVFENGDIAINTKGSDWYYAVCAVMTVSCLAVVGLAFRKPSNKRIFHWISAGLLMVAAIAYFSMGSGLGQVPIRIEFFHRGVPGDTREIFWVRYIDWFITTPLLLLDLLLTAGLPWSTIGMIVLADEVMIVCGLVGALIPTSYKWGYFTFACLAFFFVAWGVTWEGRRYAHALGPNIGRAFNICGVWTIFLWFLYPIAWGLSEGGNVISADGEAIFYGILDLLAKPVFTGLLLWGHRNIDPAELGMASRDPTAPIVVPGVSEKHQHHGVGEYNGHNGVATGNHQPVNTTATTATPANNQTTV